MASFRISLTPSRRAAARFIMDVRSNLLKAFADNPSVSQQAVAEKIGVNRSVINRQIHGRQDINLGRIAEIAWALGYEPKISLVKAGCEELSNFAPYLVDPAMSRTVPSKSFWPGSRTVRMPLEAPSLSGAEPLTRSGEQV